jgi:YidC/Oxa1 family membrane protein insertase
MLAAANPLKPIIDAIGWLLAAIYDIVPPHNLGLSIILLTCLVMLALFPLTAKQTRSMIAMQKVAPQIKRIQAEFRDDKQKQNEEVLKFYQENKINPLSGCLPLLAQMPILISLFQVLRTPANHIPTSGRFATLFTDLCGPAGRCPDTLEAHFLGIDLFDSLATSVTIPLLALVALVVLASWYQSYQTIQRQKNTVGSDSITQQMKIMTNIAPIMIGVFSINVPAGLPLYWLTSSVWRIGQQHFVLNKFYDDPEYKAIVQQQAKERKAASDNKPKAGPKNSRTQRRGDDATGRGSKPGSSKPGSSKSGAGQTSGRVTPPKHRPTGSAKKKKR